VHLLQKICALLADEALGEEPVLPDMATWIFSCDSFLTFELSPDVKIADSQFP